MPRGPRLDIPGLIYHVICRGIERKEIFKTSSDYRFLLRKLSELTSECGLRVYAFSFMPNHIHLLVKPEGVLLASFMRRLLTSYAVYFNKRHKRSGHLFQNRYASFSVQHGAYFLELVRYIHLNPVRAGIVSDVGNLSLWPYSGYGALMGRLNYPWLETDETLLIFAKRKRQARSLLQKFMHEGLLGKEEARPVEMRLMQRLGRGGPADETLIDKRIIGDSVFAALILEKLNEHKDMTIKESALEKLLESVASFYGLSLSELCSGSKRANVSKARSAAIYLGSKHLLLPPKMLYTALGVKAPTVYDIIRTGRGEVESRGISLE